MSPEQSKRLGPAAPYLSFFDAGLSGWTPSTGSHSSASAFVPSAERSVRRISGPGRLRYGFGNHSVNTSRHSSWMACGAGPDVVKTAQVPDGTGRVVTPAGTSDGADAAVITAW
ncbi:hypothetical protein SANTM175S_06631 [Streptomyces antimycoticus]